MDWWIRLVDVGRYIYRIDSGKEILNRTKKKRLREGELINEKKGEMEGKMGTNMRDGNFFCTFR